MTDHDESAVRSALEHVRQGRAIIAKQMELIEKLYLSGKSTSEAEEVLAWLKKVQSDFEEHYRTIVNEAQEYVDRSESTRRR